MIVLTTLLYSSRAYKSTPVSGLQFTYFDEQNALINNANKADIAATEGAHADSKDRKCTFSLNTGYVVSHTERKGVGAGPAVVRG